MSYFPPLQVVSLSPAANSTPSLTINTLYKINCAAGQVAPNLPDATLSTGKVVCIVPFGTAGVGHRINTVTAVAGNVYSPGPDRFGQSVNAYFFFLNLVYVFLSDGSDWYMMPNTVAPTSFT